MSKWEAYWILVGLLNEENRKAIIIIMKEMLKSQKK